jgi:hypothetical protein
VADEQEWHTEIYKGMEVHVSPLPHGGSDDLWDYTVRVAYPGEDASSASELSARSGDDQDYPSKKAAVEAGFAKGYSMVNQLLG